MKFQFKIINPIHILILLNKTALKIAADNINSDILLYLLSLPKIEIGNSCFYNCENIIKISIPSTVKSIGKYAFYHCKQLSEVNIPSSVNSIEKKFF